jgi:hypothetical protein
MIFSALAVGESKSGRMARSGRILIHSDMGMLEGRSQAGSRLPRTPPGEVLLFASIHYHSSGSQVPFADGLVDESHSSVVSFDVHSFEGTVWAAR